METRFSCVWSWIYSGWEWNVHDCVLYEMEGFQKVVKIKLSSVNCENVWQLWKILQNIINKLHSKQWLGSLVPKGGLFLFKNNPSTFQHNATWTQHDTVLLWISLTHGSHSCDVPLQGIKHPPDFALSIVIDVIAVVIHTIFGRPLWPYFETLYAGRRVHPISNQTAGQHVPQTSKK